MSHTKLPWFWKDENGNFLQEHGYSVDCDSLSVISSAPIHHNGKVICLVVGGSKVYSNDHRKELIFARNKQEIKQQAGNPEAEPILLWAPFPATESSLALHVLYFFLLTISAAAVLYLNIIKPEEATPQVRQQIDVSHVRLLVEAHKRAYRIVAAVMQ